jgi:hypothetical protein
MSMLDECFDPAEAGTIHWLCAGNKAAAELVSSLSRLLSYGNVRLAFSRVITSAIDVSAWFGGIRGMLIDIP